jgi:hypothetical protein
VVWLGEEETVRLASVLLTEKEWEGQVVCLFRIPFVQQACSLCVHRT